LNGITVCRDYKKKEWNMDKKKIDIILSQAEQYLGKRVADRLAILIEEHALTIQDQTK